MKCTFAAIFAATLILVAGDVDAQTHLDTTDQDGEGRLTGGKGNDRGTPQGGVISPALANLYMNRMLKGWRETRRGEQFGARIVNYADDFVILSRGKAKEAYFGRGSTAKAYRAVDQHVYDTVRHFLRRRHQVSSQGTRQFPEERVFGSLGVVRLPGPMGARS